MKKWPKFSDSGDLPPGIHRSTLSDVIEHFGKGCFHPKDIDIFLLMDDKFDVRQVTGAASILFDHLAAQNYEGASIFWLRRMTALDGEESAIKHWQLKRNGKKRGIVEALINDS